MQQGRDRSQPEVGEEHEELGSIVQVPMACDRCAWQVLIVLAFTAGRNKPHQLF